MLDVPAWQKGATWREEHLSSYERPDRYRACDGGAIALDTVSLKEIKPKCQHFNFLLVDGFSHIALACAVEPLYLANMISRRDLYSFSLAAENGNTATCLSGLEMAVHSGFDDLGPCDGLYVLASMDVRTRSTRPLLSALRRERALGARIGALCSGAWILADAGFLDGRSAAIHWDYHHSFKEVFPDVELVKSVFVDDPKNPTAAGGTATADYMLHVIEEEHGPDLATAVADQMVYNSVRTDTAAQRVSLQSRIGKRNSHIALAIKIMHETIEEPLSPAKITEQIGISTRQLERLFGRFLSATPKRYFTEMRLNRARSLLLQTESTVIEVGLACGFDDPGHFSRLYKSYYGVTPTHQRNKIT